MATIGQMHNAVASGIVQAANRRLYPPPSPDSLDLTSDIEVELITVEHERGITHGDECRHCRQATCPHDDTQKFFAHHSARDQVAELCLSCGKWAPCRLGGTPDSV